jgi:hypothetical protein
MSGFIEEYWQSIWSGWTPIVMAGFLLLGLKLGGWMAGYFNGPIIWAVAKFGTPILLPAIVPLFSSKFR